MKNFSSFIKTSRLRNTLLLTSFLTVSALTGQAQSLTSVQNFDGLNVNSNTELGYDGTPTFATGNSGTDWTIPNTPLFLTGTRAWGISNSTQTLLFRTRYTDATSVGNYIQFRLAAWGNDVGEGLDAADNVQIWVSIDGNTASRVATVTGRNGNQAYWDYTGTATSTVSYTANNAVLSPAGGQSIPNNLSRIRIDLPDGGHTVRFYIVATNNNTSELWTIDQVTIGSANAPLPVELKSFTAEAATKGTQLRWATASEKNSAAFEIQRSSTPNEFKTIGRVAGQGTSSRSHSYEWLDAQPLAGLSYYRLRQLDTDGTESFSPVATVQHKEGLTTDAFFPNPTTGQVTLNATLGAVKYRVLNALGQIVLTGEAQGGTTVDMHSLRTGAYFLELQSAKGHTVQRFMREQ